MKKVAPLVLLALASCSGGGEGTVVGEDTACKTWGGTFSGVIFTDGQANAAIDMADHATAAELDAVPSIGPSAASAILAARPFGGVANAVAKLDAVSGVGATILASLRDHAGSLWCELADGRQSCCGAAAPAGGVVLNEFSPGSGGWVELYNTGASPVDLGGWAVDDVHPGGASAVTIAPGTTIAPKGFVVVKVNGINSGSADQVTLIDGASTVVDQTTNFYVGASLAGACLSRSPDGGAWSGAPVACTKGTSNGGSAPASCAGQGGTYDGVAFTRDEECHAVDFLNNARFSEMRAVPDYGRLVAYESGPENVWSFPPLPWTKLAEYSGFTKIGATSVNGVKTAAATWTKNGLPYDTAESTFIHRATLVDGPVYLDKVYVTKAVPDAISEGMQCMEVRDAPAAANFLRVCGHAFVCSENVCWPKGAGAYVSARGTLRHTTMSGAGGYYLSLNLATGAPTPKVP